MDSIDITDSTFSLDVPDINNGIQVNSPKEFLDEIKQLKIFPVFISNDFFKLKKILSGFSYTDKQTEKAIKEIHEFNGYIADPHGAVGFLGLKAFIESQEEPSSFQGLFLETAHPIKFAAVVEKILKTEIQVPERLKGVLQKEKLSLPISTYQELKSFLIAR